MSILNLIFCQFSPTSQSVCHHSHLERMVSFAPLAPGHGWQWCHWDLNSQMNSPDDWCRPTGLFLFVYFSPSQILQTYSEKNLLYSWKSPFQNRKMIVSLTFVLNAAMATYLLFTFPTVTKSLNGCQTFRSGAKIRSHYASSIRLKAQSPNAPSSMEDFHFPCEAFNMSAARSHLFSAPSP